MSRESVRSTLRSLPPERRRDVVAALREGRRAADPRDAPVVAQLAERQARLVSRWPMRVWIRPATRRRRFERLIHLVLVPIALGRIGYGVWSDGRWGRWAVIAWAVLILASIPTYIQVYRALRNAPRALAENS